ncbi:MAG: RagB/SusD family nutrient uptake outer membrane protein [Saprospiraceae bacterium]|nr:RagB/SusD family nutrient uptake outer membrane protein [Saprospiraceae bacterium]
MKSLIKYSSIVVVLVLLATACSKLLDENPRDQVFIENFFETENDAVSAVNSIYAILNSTSVGPTFGGVYHSSYWIIQGLTSDEMENRIAGANDLEEMNLFNHKPVNSTAYDVWRNAYKGIANANFAIEGIPRVPMDETRKNRLIGESRFLRGLLYFDLVRMFGEIPLTLTLTDEVYPSKANLDALYGAIIADLEFAITTLPVDYSAGNGKGRATQGAAKGLLAKVHLTRGNWQNCITLCEQIIQSGTYGLWDNFADVFKLANGNGKETLFNIGFGTANNAITFWEVGQFNVRLLPAQLSGAIPGVNAQGWQVANQNLYDSYDAQDQRRQVTFLTTIQNTNGSTTTVEPHIQKYWDKEAEPMAGNTENDFPYLRYADVLLMYAEALNELNNGPTAPAYDAINAIRRRARFDGTTVHNILPDLNGLTYSQFKDSLLLERRKEFVAEGHRWFDLVRFDKIVEAVNAARPAANPQPFHRLFPLPQEEIDLNQKLLPQNPGY